MKLSRIIFVFLFAACGFASIGCAHKAETSVDDLPPIPNNRDQVARPLDQVPAVVAQGPSPLAYIFMAAGPVRVMDVTDKSQVAAGFVAANTLVRVDERNGVIAGKQTLAPGPLPTGHQYIIYADPATDNVISNSIGPAIEFQPPQKSAPVKTN